MESQKVKRLKASLSYQPIVTSDTVPTAPALPQWNQVIANTRLNVTLHEHQSRVVNFMKQKGVRGLLVWHGMGTGKTEVAITTAHALGMKAIVVATASTLPQWRERVKKLGGKGFYFYTADSFVDQGIRKCGGDYILIVDEVQRFRNEDGVKAISIQECAAKAGKVLLLTGTPIMNTPRDIAAYINMITTQETLPTKRNEWDARFGVDGLKDLDSLHSKLRCRFSYYLQDDDNPAFPRVVYENVELKMEPLHEEYYDKIEQADLASLSPLERQNLLGSIEVDINVQAFFNGVRRVSNVASVNPEKKQVFLPKIKAIAQAVIAEIRRGQSGNGPPARQMVYSYFLKYGLDPLQQMIRFLIERAVKAGTLKPAVVARIDGSTTEHNRSLIQRQYNSGKIDVLLFSGAGGTGMDMKDTSVMYFLERDWLNANISQAIHRGARMNSHTPTKDGQRGMMKVIFYELVKSKTDDDTFPSIDTYMRQLNEKKEAVNMKFIEAIIGDSIEVQHKCMTQDIARAQPPKLLQKLLTGQMEELKVPAVPPYVPGPNTTVQRLQEVVKRYGLVVDAALWDRPVKEISAYLMTKIWPSSCFGQDWKVKRILSVGSSGAVYIICKNQDCSRVSKLQLVDDTEHTIQLNDNIKVKTVNMAEVEKEYKLQSMAGDLAPKIYVVKSCKLKTGQDSYRTVVNIEMEKYDGNLLDYWKKNQAMLQVGDKLTQDGRNLVRLVVNKVRKLNQFGIVHHDMHLKNVLYKTTSQGVRFVIGDYGWATQGGLSKDVATLLSQIHKHTKVPISELKQALK